MISCQIKDIPKLSDNDVKRYQWESFEFFLLYDSKILSNKQFENIECYGKYTGKQIDETQMYYYFDERNIIEHTCHYNIEKINSPDNKMYFSCYDELCMFVECTNIVNEQIGILIMHKNDDRINLYKMYNNTYQKLVDLTSSIRFKTNINSFYIELYQQNNLTLFLPHYTKFSNDILFRVNSSFKTLSNNILNLYHATRNKKNMDIYNNLTDSYKKILFNIHGQYMINKNNDELEISSKSITVHDIYYLLKTIGTELLITLYKDTLILKNKNINIDKIMNIKCIHMLTQINLM